MKCTMHKRWGNWQCGNRAGMFKGERISAAGLSLQTWGPVWKVISHHYTQATWHFTGNDLCPCQGTVGLLEHRRRTNDICTQKGVRECELKNTPHTFVIFINTMTSTCCLVYYCIYHSVILFRLNVSTSVKLSLLAPHTCSLSWRIYHLKSAGSLISHRSKENTSYF